MATTQIGKVIHTLHEVVRRQDAAAMTDGQLLDRFINRTDNAALETLVRRLGPMVWGVCRRILRSHHDAEDAFQATFLVLVRKANSIVPRAMVRSWLYGVAHKTALKARANAAKHNERERQAIDMSEPAVKEQDPWHDLLPLLDQEICDLPEKYRAVILLCDVEGKTRKEAARQLAWPEGTVAGRLAKARAMLAKRLARHRVPASGVVAAALSESIASASVPSSLLQSTIKTANLIAAGQAAAGLVSIQVAALTEGVLKTMLLTKLKTFGTGLLLVSLVLVGGGLLAQQRDAGVTKVENPPVQPPSQKKSPRTDQPEAEGHRIVYPVADLVVPMNLLDGPAGGKTKEDWLIQKITRTIAPETWADRDGKGTIEYFPAGRALVVKNTQRVHVQVQDLLETLRRVQNIQVSVELRAVSISKEVFPKLQTIFPNLKIDGHLLLNDAEAFALLEKSQTDKRTTIVQAPKLTIFPGQRARIGVDKLNADISAMVAANVYHIDFELEAKKGQADFGKTRTRLTDGTTLVRAARDGNDGIVFLLATPRILIDIQVEKIFLSDLDAVVPPPAAGTHAKNSAAAKRDDKARLADVLKKYEQSCQIGDRAGARRWALSALEIDPACFQNMPRREGQRLESKSAK